MSSPTKGARRFATLSKVTTNPIAGARAARVSNPSGPASGKSNYFA